MCDFGVKSVILETHMHALLSSMTYFFLYFQPVISDSDVMTSRDEIFLVDFSLGYIYY